MATVAPAWQEILVGEELAHLAVEPPRAGQSEPFPDDLDPRVASALVAQGITALYSHQAETWEALRAGGNAIVTTSTASGKSLAFNLPVLDLLAREPKSRALYLYPTKALAQDQARALQAFGVKGVKPAIYDGDTESERRWQIRKWANVVLTNPDMLHVGVLPHHDRWGDVLANLRFVVVDEAHVYRGVFGSHVGNVLRRLRRLARAYGVGAAVRARVGDDREPRELAESLLGEPADRDRQRQRARDRADDRALEPGADRRRARRPRELARRRLAAPRRPRLARAADDLLREEPQGGRADPSLRVRSGRAGDWPRGSTPYRAGYTPSQRREIEQRLMAGELLGVTATDALELGIDIGSLDCAISVGFPGTVSSLRQQWGRAGRRSPGLAVLVASEDALDQYFMREPETLLARTVEAAILDHANPRVLDGHVLSAAFEGPIDEADAQTLGPEALVRAAELPELKLTDAGWVWAGKDYPAARVLLRSGELDSFTVVDAETGAVLGTVERSRAYGTIHDGAVYLHLGEQHLVRRLDVDARTALVSPANVDWYTQAKVETETAIVEPLRVETRLGLELSFGRVSVTERVVAYQRKSISGGDTLETVPLDLPETSFETEAVWFSPTAAPARRSRGDAEAALLAPRRRALADRAAAALGDVRPLGHRRPLDEHPPPDRAADDLRLRRPRRRRRDHRARLRALRGLGRGHGEDARRLPVRRGLPELRPEPEVRQPERLPRQGRRADAAAAAARKLTRSRHALVTPSVTEIAR